MLSPPADLDPGVLAAAAARAWGVTADPRYRAVGAGSHHWRAGPWFLTIDDLDARRLTRGEPRDAAYRRLVTALDAARHLHAAGLDFVVAPAGPVVRLTDRYAAACHPWLDGWSPGWGEHTPAQRAVVLDMLVAVHTAAPVPAGPEDDVAHRDTLDAALAGEPAPDCGPYAAPAARLLAARAPALRRLLAGHDALAARADPARAVPTHGEPHPGNLLHTAAGWRLVDWDTARLGQPERDLWMPARGDPDLPAAYGRATGVRPDPAQLRRYELRWQVADLAIAVARFRAPHTGTADDDREFAVLRALCTG